MILYKIVICINNVSNYWVIVIYSWMTLVQKTGLGTQQINGQCTQQSSNMDTKMLKKVFLDIQQTGIGTQQINGQSTQQSSNMDTKM